MNLHGRRSSHPYQSDQIDYSSSHSISPPRRLLCWIVPSERVSCSTAPHGAPDRPQRRGQRVLSSRRRTGRPAGVADTAGQPRDPTCRRSPHVSPARLGSATGGSLEPAPRLGRTDYFSGTESPSEPPGVAGGQLLSVQTVVWYAADRRSRTWKTSARLEARLGTGRATELVTHLAA